MARKKNITKDQILSAAYEVVITEGFSGFTARNVAKKMKCSTQPIYLEFKNMDDLKEEVFSKIYKYLEEKIFSKIHTGDPIVDVCINFIQFSYEEKMLYRSLYVEDHEGVEQMYRFTYNYVMKLLDEDEKTKSLTQRERVRVFTECWIVTQGIASLLSSGLVNVDKNDMKNILQETLSDMLVRARFGNFEKPDKDFIQNIRLFDDI